MESIPYGRQNITPADIEAVVAVLRSDFLTQGPVVPAFERAVADRVDARHAVALNSATSALHAACLAMGLKAGDMLWTSPISFVASANCALYCGARVDFVDIDRETFNLCPEALARKLEQAEDTSSLPKVVVVVHMTGQPCNLSAIHALSRRYGFRIIEDASHAIGARYRERPIGNCEFSDAVVFSFHPVKIITTGEGGMVLTNDPEIARKVALFRSHGITRDAQRMVHQPDGPWYYEQLELGYNYRMTDIQAALGLSQLQRLDESVEARHRLAERYDELLAGLPVSVPVQRSEGRSAFHLYVVRLQLERIDRSRREVFEAMRADDIGVNVHYIPIYAQPYHERMGVRRADFPQAEAYYREAISIPMFPTLSSAQQDRVVRSLRNALAP
ncbi:UDP-4-amino-4,6-dideoxy-N-acetyl-beta-L-altrosamine transaminase [Variovorax guangxiensis]|uniref:UDP-4-amino-4, 6-dideoxy-N-acetyl-beta-L-altrosamine transaminase n=1 Tax=Variovorax guangxiensis TaxID=1775474 RepID=UPI0028603F1A|nr:UDP-4-amino-4,6-dideoxy-N-acetyl-beta-L-altrosamine transaminase [Variovorax guangxiensis]MDR6854108.1 UDP-4-amino-4,6-dideoxy-N-acetyl-beta-L-altrosamine transaminase [Variovorax guangxiensis]